MNTILITGSSSGFGLETARHFLDRDWTVIATMRSPREDVLPASERLRVLALDVTDAAASPASSRKRGRSMPLSTMPAQASWARWKGCRWMPPASFSS